MSEEGEGKKESKIELTEDEIKELQKDIDDALSKIKTKSEDEIKKAKLEGKQEAEQELKRKQELEAKEKELADLKRQMELEKSNTQAQLEAMKEKMDSMISSKQVLDSKNPFNDKKLSVDTMPDEKIREIEKESEKVFFAERSRGMV